MTTRQRDRSVGATLNYKLDFAPVIDALPALLLGCLGTLWLALAGMALAIVIGIGGVVLRDSRVKLFRWLVIGFVELIRNTPFLVQIYFIFFALPLLGVRLTPTPTAIVALGVNGGAYAIENISFRSFEVYGTITLMYLVMSWLVMRLFGLISRQYFSYPVR